MRHSLFLLLIDNEQQKNKQFYVLFIAKKYLEFVWICLNNVFAANSLKDFE